MTAPATSHTGTTGRRVGGPMPGAEHLWHCQHCDKLIRAAVIDPNGDVELWEDANRITVCVKRTDGQPRYVHHKPMPVLTDVGEALKWLFSQARCGSSAPPPSRPRWSRLSPSRSLRPAPALALPPATATAPGSLPPCAPGHPLNRKETR